MSETTNTTIKSAKHERTYAQFCPIAAGLDLVGDRWVLLICRELSFGDQRFTDLRNALPRIAPNLLSERLRSLQDTGLVISAELPPPAARAVYRLTAEGRRVIPVLRAVARFGAPYLDGEPTSDFDARRAAYSLLAPWWRAPAEPRDAALRYRLAIDDIDAVDLLLEGRGLRVVAAEPGAEPDVVVTTTVDRLVAARRGAGVLHADVTGAPAAVQSFFAAFDLRPAGA
jgi:DNA-binding HxlR family transcriptional regulator